ncbi:MAG: FkbM family methyltransferase [Ignavibacteria bacterium]|jgi:FkbM family methyltransferase
MKLAFLYGGKKRFKKGKISFEGFKFVIPDYRSFLWQYKEIFVDGNYNFNSDSTEPVIYDCGANVGTSCAYFKKIYPNASIKAIEANPKIAEYLQTNINKNYLSKIEVIDKAIWVDNDGVELNFEGADASSVYTDGKKQGVNSIRLKDLLETENRVDMLKMDIEGAESEVLLDCDSSLKVVRNIFIEYHSFAKSAQNLSNLLNVLEKNNFRYFIRNDSDRNKPLINKTNKSNPDIDLQLNIFAYRD